MADNIQIAPDGKFHVVVFPDAVLDQPVQHIMSASVYQAALERAVSDGVPAHWSVGVATLPREAQAQYFESTEQGERLKAPALKAGAINAAMLVVHLLEAKCVVVPGAWLDAAATDCDEVMQ